jgi:hypothetical protein
VLFVGSGEISGGTNDLGWRAPLGSLFFLTFYGVLFFDGWRRNGLRFLTPAWANKLSPLLVLLIVFGFATTLTEFFLLRFYSVVSAERETGVHTADLRTALDFLRHNSALNAIVQLNPDKDDPVYSGLFMERGTALRAGGNIFYHYNAIDPELISETESNIEPIFEDAGLPFNQIQQECSALGIDYLVFQPVDGVFTDKRSWIWQHTPFYANPGVRIYRC